MIFSDDRDEEELESDVKAMKGTKEEQETLRDSGLLRTGGEKALSEFEDPEY